MGKNLVIVESPAKAKTIEGYLGKDYEVKSSYGHVRDLPREELSIDTSNNFEPTYEISADKKDVIKELTKLAKDAETIYLASDDDREGEAISWHLSQALKLKPENTKRIVFREITKKAIQNAIQNPRTIDINLVNAQQARRVLDRLVGYELSPILWKKVKTGLSAGRVQSVAVRLVVDREREIDKFSAQSSFKVSALFDLEKGKVLKAELPKKFDTEQEALAFLAGCKGADFSIANLETRPAKKSPAPPFTTSTLQQEASRKLGFPVAMTMTVAQKLYESGKISYMRTDSLNLSEEAIEGAKNEITKSYGSVYSKPRRFKTKSQGAQEAHEAIRPTDFSAHTVSGDSAAKKLYDLIWKRAVASQMEEAQLEKTTATIAISTTPENMIAQGEVIKFDGFLKLYIESHDDEEEDEDQKGMLPPLTIGQKLDLQSMLAKQGFTRHAPRYTEASLVKKLEEMGIGRPSTFAPTISTVIKRNYIEKESREGTERLYVELVMENGEISRTEKTEITGAEKNKLFPTNVAMIVNDFLVENFTNVIDYHFTATVEAEFDDIASGTKDWSQMIRSFYSDFHPKVEESENLKRSSVGSNRELGIDPVSGKTVVAKMGKYGAYVQIGDVEDEEKPRFASLRKGQLIESISMEEAMELFKLPRDLGEFEGEIMTANVGRFGPYIRHKGKFVSLRA
ncbi:MAG: type I DNA topoisomerase, partial [Cyclobacteriaceae bacterium]|nr:type I DNA topoisomerase [Cyclobacteriaceae bacterium]